MKKGKEDRNWRRLLIYSQTSSHSIAIVK